MRNHVQSMSGYLCMALVLVFLHPIALKADEGMWLLPLLKQQNYRKMVQMGLELKAEDIYNPDGPSLKDAIAIFDNGCTASIVTDKGLLFTNHHCGYDQIREHSSVDHNYLRDGYYASTAAEELPNPGLTVRFIDRIEEVTPYVKRIMLARHMDPLQKLKGEDLREIAHKWYKEQYGEEAGFGTRLELKAFYDGNRYFLFVQKEYYDVRLVAAPPSCIGKYGEDTDNWVWPRHSGDFSIFRVYTAADGSPAQYSPENVPMKPKKFLRISTKGVREGSFALIMGFPGTTNHFYTAKEVQERRDIDNDVRIRMRDLRQKAMIDEMRKDEKINIQYASKYTWSTNAYKNAIGTNWAIDKENFKKVKQQQEDELRAYANAHNKPEYIAALSAMDEIVEKRAQLRRRVKMIDEALLRAVEAVRAPILSEKNINALSTATPQQKEEIVRAAMQAYDHYFNKDYSRFMDKKVSKVMLAAYLKETSPEHLPTSLKAIAEEYGGDPSAYVDRLWEQTVLRDRESYQAFLNHFNAEEYRRDPLVRLVGDVRALYHSLSSELEESNNAFAQARATYLKGLLEAKGEMNLWPDANFTLRYTYGQVKGYSPRDNVFYGPITKIEGVMEKYDPNNPEYALTPKAKALFEQLRFKDFPVDFCATTHTTGGNSGSPVMDSKGRLIGLNFDRNWEGVGGDIEYLPPYQRSIICDVRYVLFILEHYLSADRLLKEIAAE